MTHQGHDKILKEAHARFKLGEEADRDQKARELEALSVYSGEGLWPSDVLEQRKAQPASGRYPAVPERPSLRINKTREPVAQILNQERENDLQVTLVPADDFGDLSAPADPLEIKLREGLIRRIQRESESADARTWAFTRAVIAGRGYYSILTRYVAGKTNDQEVYYNRIFNQNSVVMDPAHEQPDGSDADWVFIGVDLPYDQYIAEYPTAEDGSPNAAADGDNDEFHALGDDAPGWYRYEGEQKICRVVDYYYVVRTTKTLCTLPDGSLEWEDELAEGVKPLTTRKVIQKQVKFAKLDGMQVLETTDWLSPYLPVIKMVGNEIPPFNDQRKIEGIVEPARDAARGFCYMVSKWVEMIGLAPIPPFMVAEGQIEGYEGWYAMANTRAFPWLPYRTRDLEGNAVGAPQRTDVSVPISPIAASVELFASAVQSTTGVNDPQLGRNDPSLRSGVAIRAIQTQGAKGTSNYRDNYVRSLRHDARVVNSLLYPIYGRRAGRLTRMVTGEDDAELVLINQPFVSQGPAGQERPTPAQPGDPQAKVYTLTPNANHNIAVKVSKAFDTRRQEEAEMNAELMQAAPQLMTVGGDLFFKSQDGPGSQQWAERMKVMLDPKVLAVIDKDKGGPAPPSPEVVAKMQEMEQQLQMTTQAATQMQQQLQTEAQKAQSEQQMVMFKAQTEREIAQLKAQTDIQLLQMKLNNDMAIAQAKMQQSVVSGREKAEADDQRQTRAAQMDLEASMIDAAMTPQEPGV